MIYGISHISQNYTVTSTASNYDILFSAQKYDIEEIDTTWILFNGLWNDLSFWVDTEIWKD